METNEGHEAATRSVVTQYSDEAREILGPHLVPRSFRRGQLLWSEGDMNGMLVHLKTGRVKVYRLLPTGKAIVLYVFEAGTLFGFMPFLDGQPYPAYAQALEPCEAEVMYRADLKTVIRERPEVALFLLKHLSRRLRDAFETIERLSSRGTVPKVAAALAALVPADAHADGLIVVHLPIASGEFATSLGLTPETFSRAITHLVEEGLVKRLKMNTFQVLELPRLRLMSENVA